MVNDLANSPRNSQIIAGSNETYMCVCVFFFVHPTLLKYGSVAEEKKGLLKDRVSEFSNFRVALPITLFQTHLK